jgi:hypothetical protein
MKIRTAVMALGGLMALGATPAMARYIGGVACTTPQPARCNAEACNNGALADLGNAVDAKTGRKFWLDYPCDLKPGEKVTFILNIHGAGSIGNWQRHYFPAADYVQKYRLVVATPTAATMGAIGGGGGPGVRRWEASADDQHLQNIAEYVFASFGRQNIKSFWLAGHSQGGGTSHRIVCSDYFKDKVDGLLSLSGGRLGRAEIDPRFGPPLPNGDPPPPRQLPAAMSAPPLPSCEFSHIYETGQHEIVALPDTSPWAAHYGCAARVRRPDIVDDKAGYVWDYARAGYKVWGMKARPGKAEVYVYPNCRGGRVVTDVVREDKGHTEGLEPHVTEALVKMIADAPGGKLQGKS